MGGTAFLVRAGLGGTLRVLRVPEPSSMVLLGLGLAVGLVHVRRHDR